MFLEHVPEHVGDQDPDTMPSLTYVELAQALNIGTESAIRLARRKRWQRVKGNDRKTRVSVPDEALIRPVRSPDTSRNTSPDSSPDMSPIISPDNARLISALEGHVATLKEQLVAADARTEAERARADQAIVAFATLADRLDVLAADRRRSFWRRLIAAG